MSGIDLTESIEARSDQINADDLIAGPATYTIREVVAGVAEPPFDFKLVETDRAYRPSKSMRRVIVAAWGADAAAYAGRRLTLYREPTIKYAGVAVGGIRVSHMSHIHGPVEVMAQTARGKREKFIVHPLPELAPGASPGGAPAAAPSDPPPAAAQATAPEPAAAAPPAGGSGAAAAGDGPSLKDQYAQLADAERDELRRRVPIPDGAKLSDVAALLGDYGRDLAALLEQLRLGDRSLADLQRADKFQREVDTDTLPPTASQALELAGNPEPGAPIPMYGDGAPS